MTERTERFDPRTYEAGLARAVGRGRHLSGR